MRNGERTPESDEDLYFLNSYTSWGRGQLTKLGRQRAHYFGLLLRQYYANLLSTDSDLCVWDLINKDYSIDYLDKVLIKFLRRDIKGGVKLCGSEREKIDDNFVNEKKCSDFSDELSKLRKSKLVKNMLSRYDGLFR